MGWIQVEGERNIGAIRGEDNVPYFRPRLDRIAKEARKIYRYLASRTPYFTLTYLAPDQWVFAWNYFSSDKDEVRVTK